MNSTPPAYHQSQHALIRAERLQREGDDLGARCYYAEAARLQREMIETLPEGRVRTVAVFQASALVLEARARGEF